MTEKELVDFLIKNKHKSNRQLEKILNISRHRISQIRKKYGIDQVYKKVTEEQKQYIINNAFKKTSEELSKEIGIPPSTIRRIWKENNINKNKNFNPPKEEFIELYNKLKSSRKMAQFYSVSKNLILKYAKEIGYKNQKLLSEIEIKNIIDSYHNYSSSKLAKIYGCSKSTICKIWREANLKGKYKYKYNSNFDYFENIDSPDKAYFLGLIASDGCVYSRDKNQKLLSISLQSIDEEILIKFLECINSNNPINHHKEITEKGKIKSISSIQIVSNKLCNDLEKYNIVPQKTWKFSPVNIPEEFMNHFIRGYFDGDGCISCTHKEFHKPSSYNISIVGNQNTIKFFNDVLIKNNIKSNFFIDKRKTKNELYILYITNIKSKFRFINYIYENCGDLYLKRKKDLCDKFVEAVLLNKTKRSFGYK